MMKYIDTQRKAIDAFANLNPKDMQAHREADQQAKPAPTVSTTELNRAVAIENARCLKKYGHTEPVPISAPEAQLVDTSLIMSEHDADRLDDRMLWEFLGEKSAHGIKAEAYERMMMRRDNLIITPKGFAACR